MTHPNGTVIQVHPDQCNMYDHWRPFIIIGPVPTGYLIVPLTTSEAHADILAPIPRDALNGLYYDSWAKHGNPRVVSESGVAHVLGRARPEIVDDIRDRVAALLSAALGMGVMA